MARGQLEQGGSARTGLSIRGLSKSFVVDGRSFPVLEDIDLDIAQGEFVCVVGHSGCGKSTLLRVLAGLLEPDAGEVDIESFGAMVFQDNRLLPWMTIEQNVGFGLYGLSRAERRDRVLDQLDKVGLADFAQAYPHQLSGGMKQRASIARALVHEPSILLLDEPFGALDALTRIQMQQEVLRIWERERMTTLLVTHDIDEAVYLGDRIIVSTDRPFRIKEQVRVDLPRPRVRSSPEFSRIKQRVLDQFFDSEIVEPEYYL